MSAAPTNQLFPYTNKIRWQRLYNSGVLGTSVAQCRHPGGRPLRCRIRHLRPSAPDRRQPIHLPRSTTAFAPRS